MYFHLNDESAPLLFLFVQLLIFSGLLFGRGFRQGHRPSRWLAAFVGLAALYLVPWMCGHAKWYVQDGYRDFLFFVPFQQLFLLGPVIYFYVRNLLQPQFRLRLRDGIHFIPAALYLLYSLVVFVVDVLIRDEYYFYADGWDMDLDIWYQVTGLVMLTGYVGFSMVAYNQYRRKIFDEVSYAETVLFGWVRRFLLALLLIVFLRMLFFVVSPEMGDFSVKWWYYFMFGALAYYIGLAGYGQSVSALVGVQVRRNEGVKIERKSEPETEVKEEKAIELSELAARIVALMEGEELYTNPGLTLTDVAQRLETTSKQVSTVVNQSLQLNFNDFVNQYRVEAVKKRIEQGEHHQYTLLSIALDCGFNSKSTFNRVFKKWTGSTPLQFASQFGPN